MRSKATEVMLATSPTMKTDLYKFSLDPKVSHHSLLDIRDLAVEKSKDESLKSSGGTAFHDFKGDKFFALFFFYCIYLKNRLLDILVKRCNNDTIGSLIAKV